MTPEARLKEIERLYAGYSGDVNWLIARCKRLTEAGQKVVDALDDNYGSPENNHYDLTEAAEKMRKALEQDDGA